MIDVEYHAMQQGSVEWHRIRMGCVTASEFATVLMKGKGGAESKTRRTYMLKLAGEILTGELADQIQTDHMLRGQMMEDEARDYYAMREDVDLERIGFARARHGKGFVGASPDSLVVGAPGLVEIKTRLPHLQLGVLLTGKIPDEHYAQVQGQLWVTGREWCDYVSYWPRLKPLVARVHRDEQYISTLSAAVEAFLDELDHVVETVRAM
ncbi:MAG: YqaJ viral recombinase family protein [Planctomycetes bacterium]|nr:YqaJ viral recombinase family protein [Planctomycetota bacterium]